MRPRSTSARASGRAMSALMAPAATSSSAKNALPSERARIRSTTAAGPAGRRRPGGARPARPGRRGARSAPARGGGPARPAAAAGDGGGAARRSGSWPPGDQPPRGSGSGRPAGRGWRRSAQWRSSITSGSEASSDRRTSSDSTPSNSWTRSKPSPGGGTDPWSVASSGRSRPRLGTAAASEAALGLTRPECRGRGRRRRRARREADVADLHAAADQHPDAAALGPSTASSSSSRVLPTPASPAISPTAGRPRSGPVEQGEQAVELLGPADEAAGGGGGHAGKYGPPGRQRGTPPSH